MKTAEFGQPAARVPQPGRCRICGCVEDRACLVPFVTTGPPADGGPQGRLCGWADETRTLCDTPSCIAAAKREIGR